MISTYVDCPRCSKEFGDLIALGLHLHGTHGIALTSTTVEGSPADDNNQNLADAERTVTSAQATLRRMNRKVSHWRAVLLIDVAVLVLAVATMILSGFIADLVPGLATTVTTLFILSIPAIIVSLGFGGVWMCYGIENLKLFKDRDQAEDLLDRAETQRDAVKAREEACAEATRLRLQEEELNDGPQLSDIASTRRALGR